MQVVAEMLMRLKNSGIMSNIPDLTPQEWAQKQVDNYNADEGSLHEKDGYNCPICKNKGLIAFASEYPAGTWTRAYRDCRCVVTRNSIERMRKSGLENMIKDYTFDKYEVTEPWQKAIKDAAVEYTKTRKGWFFIGGQTGSGKTHICTAICREFLLEGKQVVYMMWREDIARLKGLAMDVDERQCMIDRFKKAEVLYVDDLFKTGKGYDGEAQKPTGADINVAFEIFNYRYNNPQFLTIVSSESTIDDILHIDEATGGRIFERAVVFNLAADQKRNYRLRKARSIE